jgi:hypothetical protein
MRSLVDASLASSTSSKCAFQIILFSYSLIFFFSALSDVAITGVGASARKAYTTQALALEAFNQALVWGGVQVL